MKTASLKALKTALQMELDRSMSGLKAPGHPRPSYISYLVKETEGFSLWGRLGALCSTRRFHSRKVFCDMRIGSYRFDQTTNGGLEDNDRDDESYKHTKLPIADSVDALRFSLWRLTDTKYREAVSDYHTRRSEMLSYIDENEGLASFTKAPIEINESFENRKPVELEKWKKYVKEATGFLKPYLDIQNHYVDFKETITTHVFKNSEGRSVAWQTSQYTLSAYLWLLAPEGHSVELEVMHNVADPQELPTIVEFRKQIRQKIKVLRAISESKPLVSYSGPALLAPGPSGLLFHEVLGHRLEGNRLLSEDEGKTFKDKTNQLITHPSLNIYDDPSLSHFQECSLFGHYQYDDEGTKAECAKLVSKGKLKGFLTTRTPINKGKYQSNGHARNASFQRPISRMGNLIIESIDGETWHALRKKLIAIIKKNDLPFGIILHEAKGGETGTESYDFQAFLGEITIATMLFPDGSEAYVRGIDFVGTPLSALSNIIATGDVLEVDNAYCGAESGTIPVTTVSPAILVSNLELQAKDEKRVTQYILPMP